MLHRAPDRDCVSGSDGCPLLPKDTSTCRKTTNFSKSLFLRSTASPSSTSTVDRESSNGASDRESGRCATSHQRVWSKRTTAV
ncbi:uncharacterized protein B0H18DRAFT_1009204 [Fomitopsis serialis]|uniref:uncharacterized protein n=1 Tax=Fomitopsis serialis TaxID=139415 RepID=UPI002008B7B3|nr:uncharacterized protein B0H18DRAFT_1009204 [Neoantrodia serialis]KAH9925232.1 hypothetical protein B0H18DRAFT_1009204 [Neoantrodia serialis]